MADLYEDGDLTWEMVLAILEEPELQLLLVTGQGDVPWQIRFWWAWIEMEQTVFGMAVDRFGAGLGQFGAGVGEDDEDEDGVEEEEGGVEEEEESDEPEEGEEEE